MLPHPLQVRSVRRVARSRRNELRKNFFQPVLIRHDFCARLAACGAVRRRDLQASSVTGPRSPHRGAEGPVARLRFSAGLVLDRLAHCARNRSSVGTRVWALAGVARTPLRRRSPARRRRHGRSPATSPRPSAGPRELPLHRVAVDSRWPAIPRPGWRRCETPACSTRHRLGSPRSQIKAALYLHRRRLAVRCDRRRGRDGGDAVSPRPCFRVDGPAAHAHSRIARRRRHRHSSGDGLHARRRRVSPLRPRCGRARCGPRGGQRGGALAARARRRPCESLCPCARACAGAIELYRRRIDGLAVGRIARAFARRFRTTHQEPQIISTDAIAAELGEWARGYALDQRLSGAKARRDLGWTPTHLDPEREIARLP